MSEAAIRVLRVLLIGAMLVTALVQIVGLPWLSGVVAQDLPDEAYMRWPVLILAEVGLLWVQLALLATFRLLGLMLRDELVSSRARPWAGALLVSFLGMSGTCIAMLAYQGSTVGGPPPLSLFLLLGVVGGIALAVVVGIQRSRLPRTAAGHEELATVR